MNCFKHQVEMYADDTECLSCSGQEVACVSCDGSGVTVTMICNDCVDEQDRFLSSEGA